MCVVRVHLFPGTLQETAFHRHIQSQFAKEIKAPLTFCSAGNGDTNENTHPRISWYKNNVMVVRSAMMVWMRNDKISHEQMRWKCWDDLDMRRDNGTV